MIIVAIVVGYLVVGAIIVGVRTAFEKSPTNWDEFEVWATCAICVILWPLAAIILVGQVAYFTTKWLRRWRRMRLLKKDPNMILD